MRWETWVLFVYHVLFLMLIATARPASKSEQSIRAGLVVTSGLALVLVWRLR